MCVVCIPVCGLLANGFCLAVNLHITTFEKKP